MATRRRFRYVHATMAWLLATLLVLTLLDALSYELMFVLSLIGVLIVTELTAPLNVSPVWRKRLKWILAIGLLIFAGIVIRRIIEILQPVIT